MTRKKNIAALLVITFFTTHLSAPFLSHPTISRTIFGLSGINNSIFLNTSYANTTAGKEACADVPDGQGDQAAGTTGTTSTQAPQMKKNYCDAARNEDKAGGKNKAFAAVYLAVGSICLIACINRFGGPMMEKVCTYSFLGASVTEGIFTKNFLGPVMGAMPLVMNKFGGGSEASGGGTAAKSAPGTSTSPPASGEVSTQTTTTGSTSTTNPSKSSSKLNKTACISCAMAFALAAMKFLSANKSKDRAEEMYTEAAKFPSTQVPDITSGGAGTTSPGSSESSSTTGNSGASSNNSSSTNTQPPEDRTGSNLPATDSTTAGGGANTIRDPNAPNTSPTSTDVCASGSTEQILSCAIAADPSLSDTVNNPDFGRAFQEASGIPLGDFLKNPGKDIGDAFGRATGGGLGGAAEPLKSTLEKLADPKLNLEEVGSQYSGGGGGGGSGAQSGADDGGLGEAFKNLLGGLGGQNPDNGRNPSGGKSLYADGRDPAHDEVFQNRSISLFERVTHRMKKVTPKSLENLPPATPYNRALQRN